MEKASQRLGNSFSVTLFKNTVTQQLSVWDTLPPYEEAETPAPIPNYLTRFHRFEFTQSIN